MNVYQRLRYAALNAGIDEETFFRWYEEHPQLLKLDSEITEEDAFLTFVRLKQNGFFPSRVRRHPQN